jgi:hypothetical protein
MKEELFKYLAWLSVMYVSLICEAKGVFNNREQGLCCIPRNIDDLSPYTNEEADIQMLLHAVTQYSCVL